MNSVIKQLIDLDVRYASKLETFEIENNNMQEELALLRSTLLQQKKAEAEEMVQKNTAKFEAELAEEKAKISQGYDISKKKVGENFNQLKDELIKSMYEHCIGEENHGK